MMEHVAFGDENKNWKRVAFGNGRFVVIADSMRVFIL